MGGTADSHASGSTTLYWVFCVILCLITAIEWGIFEMREPWNISNALLIASLSVCSLIKFVMVVGWYMHLRYDIRMLKNVFIFSLLLASGVFVGLMLLMT